MKITPVKLIYSAVLAIVILFAFNLRTAGLYHGLDRDYIYHPDTPKQIAAIQEYLEGRYYTVKGNLNYDGYPFFNSRLMELGVRLRGVFGGDMTPSRLELFRQTRLLNASFSTVAVLLVFLIVIGICGSWPAALLAALFQALSPVDVVACHYAMGDTTAAFFATLTVLFAVRIYKTGSFKAYVAAGIALTCAFASKYHGAAAGISIATAHLLRYPPKQFFSKSSLYRIAATSAAALVSLPLAIPSMFTKPVKTVENILAFLKYTSNFKMSNELMQKNLVERWIFGVTHNYPDFAYMLTGGLLMVALVGAVLLLRKNRAVLIAAVLPAIYMFVGLPFKPLSHIEYHTLVSPCLFALAAMTLAAIPITVPRKFRNPAITLTAAACTVVCGLLLQRSIYHDFYFSSPDTRALATDWVYHNLPKSFQVAAGHYSYLGVPPTVPKAEKMGVVMLSSSFRPHHAPSPYASKFEFNLHDTRLELFRNPVITLYIHRSPWLKPGWSHPTFQTVPYGENDGLVSSSMPVFNRNPLQHTVSPNRPLDIMVLSETAITNVALILQAADADTVVSGSFGGRQFSAKIPANAARMIEVSDPARRLPRVISAKLYSWKAAAKGGPVMVTLAITPEHKAVALTKAGLMAEARAAFASGAETNSPAINIMRSVAFGTPPPLHKKNLFNTFGIAGELLETAPAITVASNVWQKAGAKYTTQPVFLAPGCYAVDGNTNLAVSSCGSSDNLLQNGLFTVPFGAAAIKLHASSPQELGISVKPDRTLQFYRTFGSNHLRAAAGGQASQ